MNYKTLITKKEIPFEETLELAENKVRINLSDYARNIIENDCDVFAFNDIRGGMSLFLSTIFINYYYDSPANLERFLSEKKEEYMQLFSLKEIPGMAIKDRDKIISVWLETALNDKAAELVSYAKGNVQKGFNMRVSPNAKSIIYSLGENSLQLALFKRLGIFLKAVLENYALLAFHEREAIIYKNNIDDLQLAIQQQCPVIIYIGEQVKYDFIPYKIVCNPMSNYNYVIGLSRKSSDSEYVIASFRISRIKKIYRQPHKRVFETILSKKKKKEIEELIVKNDVQFLLNSESNKFKVKFTDYGLQKYKTYIQLRPQGRFENEYDRKNNIMTFDASEYQMEAYFFKFGADALIIHPIELRSRLCKKYEDAYALYNNNETLYND